MYLTGCTQHNPLTEYVVNDNTAEGDKECQQTEETQKKTRFQKPESRHRKSRSLFATIQLHLVARSLIRYFFFTRQGASEYFSS